LIFIDETWTKSNMTRHYGWAKMGHRLVDAVPHGHWNTSTFIAGQRRDGMVAPCVFDGAINGEAFLAYVEPTGPAAGEWCRLRPNQLILLLLCCSSCRLVGEEFGVVC
jgi:DDE superfamily endonuclease